MIQTRPRNPDGSFLSRAARLAEPAAVFTDNAREPTRALVFAGAVHGFRFRVLAANREENSYICYI